MVDYTDMQISESGLLTLGQGEGMEWTLLPFWVNLTLSLYPGVNGYLAMGSDSNCRMLIPCRLLCVWWLNTPQGVEKAQG